MTSRVFSRTFPRNWDGTQFLAEDYSCSSPNSPVVNGKLVLRANPHTLSKRRSNSNSSWGSYGGLIISNLADVQGYVRSRPTVINAINQCHVVAYGKLRGKLYEGNASLGVTLASWRESRDMIVKNSRIISSAAEDLSALSSKGRLTKRLADRHLEVIFGWQPLLADIHAAATTVIQSAAQDVWIRTSKFLEYTHDDIYRRPGWSSSTDQFRGNVRVTYAAGVRIDNPNLWLAERAGLMNPLAVAWDLVPWSFLINMFTNMGSLVNSISDFRGLSFHDFSVTEKHSVGRWTSYGESYPGTGGYSCSSSNTWKNRTLSGPIPPRSLTFRVPDLDWSTAAMAASLMVQQATKPMRLIQALLKK